MLHLFFYKNKNIIVFALLISSSIFALSKSSKAVNSLLGDSFFVIAYPFTWLFHKSSSFVSETYNNVLYFNDTLDEMKKVQKILRETKELEQDNNHLIREIIKLKEQLNYLKYIKRTGEIIPSYNKIPVQFAEIIIRDSAGRLFNNIILNKGKKHGIKENMPVIAFQSIDDLENKPMFKLVVGKIKDVSMIASKLLPINSSQSIIHVRLKNNTYTGFIEGRGPIEKNLLLKNIDKRAAIKIGDEVVTTGGQSLFPPGIHIGYIIKDNSNEIGFMKKAIVKPYVNFDKLNYVFIIKKELSSLKPLLER